jgi:hypothetical protein
LIFSAISRLHVDAGNFPIRINFNEELNRVATDVAVFVVILAACGNVDFRSKV